MSEHATDEEAVQQMLLLDAAEQTYLQVSVPVSNPAGAGAGCLSCWTHSEPVPLLQAINDCLQGNTAAADASLTTLGCTQRLSAAIWQAAATSHPHNTPQQQQQPRQSPVAVCDCPLPPDLLSALQAAFDGGALDDNSSSSSSSSSDFWQLHDYDDPATPFFSYLIDLQAAAAKLAAAAAAAGSRASGGPATACQQQQDLPNALELSALLLQQHISQLTLPATAAADSPTAAAMAEAARRATHVEWWTHTRPPWAPHQLHFDAAEGAFRHGLGEYRLLHPALSSVVYLTGVSVSEGVQSN
jgi:hypothetical protein